MTRTESFNLRMDIGTADILTKLAYESGLPKAQIIRDMIHARHGMLHELKPVCSTGAPCMMAGVWMTNANALRDAKQLHLQGLDPPPIPKPHFQDVG